MYKFKNISKHLFFILFLIGYITFSLLTYKDFGLTSDEFIEKKAAQGLNNYLSAPATPDRMVERYHFSLENTKGHHPLTTKYQRSYQAFQNVINRTDSYEIDHLINLLSGSFFFIIAYILFYIHYKSSLKASIGLLFLFFTPRLIGDIPSNNKDVPFALMFLASLGAIYITTKYKINNYLKVLILGILFGFTETFRAPGFTLYLVYILFYFIHAYQNSELNRKNTLNFLAEFVLIAVVSIPFSIIFFPWLGSNLISNMNEFLLNSQSFQNWDNKMFFEGQFLSKDQRPWYYLFTWIGITTPVVTLAFLPIAVANIKKYFKNELFLLSFLALVINLVLYLTLQPVIYNALRHFLYILPCISIIAAIAFIDLMNTLNTKYKRVLIGLVVLNAALITYYYVAMHPYQYIYFNELIGGLKGAQGRYEMDYWGATYKEASQWLSNKEGITKEDYVTSCDAYTSVDYYDGDKFSMVTDGVEPNYSICDYEGVLYRNNYNGLGTVVYEIKRMGVVLNTIKQF